jgi:2-hydroxy-3-oxopropionate reductase
MTIEAVGEALLFAAKAGDDPSRAPGLDGRLPCSKVLEVHGDRMVKRTFDPGFRIARHQNDLNLAPTAARQMGASPPNTATRQELFNACAALGGSAWDRSAKIKALELLSGCEVA